MDERENELQEDLTVLEYLQGRLRGDRPVLMEQQVVETVAQTSQTSSKRPIFFLVAAIFFLIGQFTLEYFRDSLRTPAIVFYLFGFISFLLARRRRIGGLSFWKEDGAFDKT